MNVNKPKETENIGINASDLIREPKEYEKMRKKLDASDHQAKDNLNIIWRNFKLRHGKMTQEEFALSIGWTQSVFSQHLTGKMRINERTAIKLAKAFGCSAGDIRPDLIQDGAEKELKDIKNLISENVNNLPPSFLQKLNSVTRIQSLVAA